MGTNHDVSPGGLVDVVAREDPGPDALRAWDLLVDRAPGTDVTQLSVWAGLRGRVGFTPLYLLAYRGGELVGGAQILTRRVPLLGLVGYLPYGPLVAPGAAAAADVRRALVDAVVALGQRRLRILFVQPPEGAQDTSDELLHRGFRPSSAGIAPPATNSDRFRHRFGIKRRYMIYAGRIDKSKQTDVLLKNYAAYRCRNDDLDLVLIGRQVMNVPKSPGIHALGYVNEEEKFDAIAAAEFLVMPSALESLSMALLEAWSLARPTLANATSKVLAAQTIRSNAGLCYATPAQFIAAVSQLRHADLQSKPGENSRRFVTANYNWPKVVQTYVTAYEDFARERS